MIQGIIWPDENHDERLLVLLTDSASYMMKAGKSLSVFYENMIHLTCIAHGIHRVAEEIRNQFPKVNSAISLIKKIFMKAPSRIQIFKSKLPEVPLPPEPVLTRWATWLKAALYYAEHISEILKVQHARTKLSIPVYLNHNNSKLPLHSI